MKQTIEIEVPDGKKAVWKDGKVVFEDIKPKLPKTWEEFCKIKIKPTECYISHCSIIASAGKTSREILDDKNILPSKQSAEQHLVLMQLHQLRDCYRQGWKPDWKDKGEKYVIVNVNNIEYAVDSSIYCSYFLAFQDRRIAEEFLKNFRDLIEQAGDLI